MDNAADRKAIRQKEKQSAIADASRQSVLHSVMSTIEGRTFLWDFLASCHIFSTTFTGDALTSAFAEGERNVGQRLLSDIMIACPDLYIQAMRESNERYHSDDARANALAERRRGEDSDGGDTGREGYDLEGGRYVDDPDTYNSNGTIRTDH